MGILEQQLIFYLLKFVDQEQKIKEKIVTNTNTNLIELTVKE